MRNCAVMGVAMGYGFEAIQPFVDSLLKTGYRGQVVMFTSHVSADTRRLLHTRGVETIPFYYRSRVAGNSWSRFHARMKFLLHVRPRFLARCLYRVVCELGVARFFLYADYLKQHPEIEWVLLADVCDIVFQRDPFANDWNDGIHVFQEDASKCIGACCFNSTWIRDLFGEEILEKLSGKVISCAGTIMGDRVSMLRYLERFIQTLDRVQNMNFNGSEQGIHNFLVHDLCPAEFVVHPNNELVCTLGHVPAEAIRLNRQDEVVDEAGEVIPILHQYNRQPQLAPILVGKDRPSRAG